MSTSFTTGSLVRVIATGSVATVVSHRVAIDHGFTVYLVTVKIRRTGQVVELPVDDITDQY